MRRRNGRAADHPAISAVSAHRQRKVGIIAVYKCLSYQSNRLEAMVIIKFVYTLVTCVIPNKKKTIFKAVGLLQSPLRVVMVWPLAQIFLTNV